MTIGKYFVDSNEEAFIFKFDLKSGYHHIDVNRDFQKYLAFSWTFRGKKCIFSSSIRSKFCTSHFHKNH